MVKNADWIKIKNEYINKKISYKKLAEKHGISFSSIEKRARAENWKFEREKQCEKIEKKVRQKTQDKIVQNEVAKIDRIAKLNDRVIDKLEEAIEQLDSYIVTCKQTQTTTKYDDKSKKPKKQVTKETAKIEILDGIVDRLGLKRITSALKDVQGIKELSGGGASGEPTLEELLSGVRGDEY